MKLKSATVTLGGGTQGFLNTYRAIAAAIVAQRTTFAATVFRCTHVELIVRCSVFDVVSPFEMVCRMCMFDAGTRVCGMVKTKLDVK